jgi:putative endonuclease
MGVFRWFWARLRGKLRDIGAYGEAVAGKFVKKRGYVVVAYNWRFEHGEIDIVARDGDVLVFVEVRLRSKNAAVRGYESISRHKKDTLRRTCLAYLKRCTKGVIVHRFDVIDIEHDYETGGDTIHHYENVPLF